MADEQTFEHLVTHQLTQVTNLQQTLVDEKEILQQQSPSALVEITEQKKTLLLAIDNTDKQLKQFTAFKEFVALPKISSLIENIENLLTECKKLNDVNGLIIQQSSLAIERMTSSLLEKRSKSSMTYDNKGKKNGGVMGKSIKA
mgnify:CR=1 FL=1